MQVDSVNVSEARTVEYDGAEVRTGIFKTPVAGRVPLRGVNLAGDDQADRAVHGGPDRAIYAYAAEDYGWWRESEGRTVAPGTFGENLTLRGVDVSNAVIGERWRVGSTVLRVTSPRVPCNKLAMAMRDPKFVKAFARALRPGTYLAVETEGDIAAGDPVEILSRPGHGLSVADVARIYFFERGRVAEMLRAPELPEEWREWAAERVAAGSN
jgi:MOSC domain-containing protein YiiM